MLGIIEGTAETIAALLKLYSGLLSDKLGKRKGLILTGLVSAAWQIIVIRMFDRVGKGLRSAPRDAMIAAVTPAESRGRAYGFHRAMDHAGAVLDPILAGFGNAETRSQLINILFLPLIWAFFHMIKVLFATPLGALSDKVGRKLVISLGWGIYAFACLTFLPARLQVPATFVLFAIYALFYAFTEGAEKAFVSDLVAGEQRGSAFGMFHFATGLGALPASLIFGALYNFFDARFPGLGRTVAFGFGACLALTAMLLLAMKVKEPA